MEPTSNDIHRRRLRMAMVGGGIGAFIGDIHRKAAALDNQIELIGGAFSRSAENSVMTGNALYLASDRVYPSWRALISAEASRPPRERLDLISIVTPNDAHLPVALASMEAGFHVISDKPATRNLVEAKLLQQAIVKCRKLYALTHTYVGYPMVKEARAMVAAGMIGRIRKVYVNYPQGWLSFPLEATGQKQAEWRTDPVLAGPSGCMGDIGTHAAALAEYVVGDLIKEVCTELSIFVKGRRLDDDGAVLFRMRCGATGTLAASQICNGEENDLSIRVYGETGGLEWRQQEPNSLWLRRQSLPARLYRAGLDNAYLSPEAKMHLRTPSGHPEGYLEAFANIYRNFSLAIRAHESGGRHDSLLDYPTIDEGLSSLAFVDAVLRNASGSQKWTSVDRA